MFWHTQIHTMRQNKTKYSTLQALMHTLILSAQTAVYSPLKWEKL